MTREEITLGNLYETLCNAQYIADELKNSHADQIMEIRQKIGQEYLSCKN